MTRAIFVFVLASLLSFTGQAQTSTVPGAAVPGVDPVAQPTETTGNAPEWKPRMAWSGDLRYRLRDDKDLKVADSDARRSQFLRARLGVKADVNEQVQAVLRFATDVNPIGSNQRLGEPTAPGMPRRSFGVDWAFIDWTFAPSAHLTAGRIANPLWSPGKVQTIYDSDLAFEGLGFKYELPLATSTIFLNGFGSILADAYTSASGTTPGSDETDPGILALELGYSLKTEAVGTWTAHVATHNFANLQNKPFQTSTTPAETGVNSASGGGNSGNSQVSAGGLNRYANKYNLTEAGLEWKGKLGATEVTAFFDHVKNNEVSEQNTAQEYGVAVKAGNFLAGVAQIKKEKDAVVGAFTDSDTSGGGTDNKGLRYTLGYQLGRNSQVQLTHYDAKRTASATETKFTRSDLDFMVSF